MSDIIMFPISQKKKSNDLDSIIEKELEQVTEKDREKLKFALLKTVDSYDGYFTEWALNIPDDCEETLKKQIYDIAHQEYHRKMKMLKDIIKLKLKTLISEYKKNQY